MMEFLGKRKYPVDISGVSPDNRVVDERHRVNTEWRAIVPDHAPFFAERFRVHLNGRELEQGRHYVFKDLATKETQESGKSVYNTVIFTDTTISGEVYMTYQCYGDPMYPGVLAKYIDQLGKDSRATNWTSIINKPPYYPPEPHQHFMTDVYGLGPMARGLHAIAHVLTSMRIHANNQVYGIIQNFASSLNQRLDSVDSTIRAMKRAELLVAEVQGNVNSEIDRIRTEILSGLRDGSIPTGGMTTQQRAEVLEAARQAWTTKTNELTTADTAFREQLAAANRRITTLEARPVPQPIAEGTYITPTVFNERLANLPEKTRLDSVEQILASKVSTLDLTNQITEAKKHAAWATVTGKPTLMIGTRHSSTTPTSQNANTYTTYGDSTEYGVQFGFNANNNPFIFRIGSDKQLKVALGSETFTNIDVPWTSVSGKPTHFPTDWNLIANKPTTLTAPTWTSIVNKPVWLNDLENGNVVYKRGTKQTIEADIAFHGTPHFYKTIDIGPSSGYLYFSSSSGELSLKKNDQVGFIYFNPATGIIRRTSPSEDRVVWSNELTWENIRNKPTNLVTGTSGVTSYNDLTNKPTVFPTNWANVAGAPATATRWPTWNEVTSKPVQATRWPTWDEVTGKPTNLGGDWTTLQNIPASLSTNVANNFANFVTLAGEQTITGAKTFSNGLSLGAGVDFFGSNTSTSLSMTTAGIFVFDANGIQHKNKRFAYRDDLNAYIPKDSSNLVTVTTPLSLTKNLIIRGSNNKQGSIGYSTDNTGLSISGPANKSLILKEVGDLTYDGKRVLTTDDLTTVNASITSLTGRINQLPTGSYVPLSGNSSVAGIKTFTDVSKFNAGIELNQNNGIVKLSALASNAFRIALDESNTIAFELLSNGNLVHQNGTTRKIFATQDYLTWANVSGKPNVMTKDAIETVTGTKVFANGLKLGTSTTGIGTISNTSSEILIGYDAAASQLLIGKTGTLKFGTLDVLLSKDVARPEVGANGAGLIKAVASGSDLVTAIGRVLTFKHGTAISSIVLDSSNKRLTFDQTIAIPNAIITSDERLKNNIVKMANVSDKLSNLSGYTFTMKRNDECKSAGVIAQEVEQYFPEFVEENSDGEKAVNYNGLIGALLSGFGEMYQQVKDLKEEINKLKG